MGFVINYLLIIGEYIMISSSFNIYHIIICYICVMINYYDQALLHPDWFKARNIRDDNRGSCVVGQSHHHIIIILSS